MNVDVCLCTESRLKQIEVELKWYRFLFTFQSTQHISNCIINKGEVPELKVQLRKHFINRQLNMMMGTWEVIPQFGVSFCFPGSYLATLFAFVLLPLFILFLLSMTSHLLQPPFFFLSFLWFLFLISHFFFLSQPKFLISLIFIWITAKWENPLY